MPISLEENEIRSALSQGEGQFREFKSAWDRGADPPKKVEWRRIRDKIADAVAAFANADGGMLFVGVEDDGEPTGHGYKTTESQPATATSTSRLRNSLQYRGVGCGQQSVAGLGGSTSMDARCSCSRCPSRPRP